MATKKTAINELRILVRQIIKESGVFNDAGEPNMTHQQYRDYSEPSEPDYDEINNTDHFDIRKELKDMLKQNDILLESFNGREYFIRCNGHIDFMVYFINDEEIEIHLYNDENKKEEKNHFDFSGALDYILNNKNLFYTFEQSVNAINHEYRIDASDRHNNAMEKGGYGMG